ncbi:PTS system mannose/fructose/N-acetylgalactosamine-transporter subunit IIB [Zophobihabitans entericus]|uniref:PTS sugar transporter subunit IIB n=1 Tax=Zophobihabitans entericus TaxID=1635327 RepID=A0A6G9ICM5_9GAMM|nr:PTS sugar transporter subunit IIB [Zophobihabitans entericus]QIQ21569.1 PTS sugar transporter subunit IIB [Zophobihabitans entericus]
MPINFARIDDRLIHGQVVTTWIKAYDVEQIIVVNDKVAADTVQQSVLTMAAPPGIKVVAFGVNQFVEILKKTEIKKKTMLIFSTCLDVLPLVESGLKLDKLNVGGMRKNDERKVLSRAVSVTPAEEEAFRKLLATGLKIEVQMVPKDPIVQLSSILN